ncbi:MAG: hypothetical protein HY721_01855 [Planctomycetes bacterium]|nr:hypothetical protein [Planctomycetota bacterium]
MSSRFASGASKSLGTAASRRGAPSRAVPGWPLAKVMSRWTAVRSPRRPEARARRARAAASVCTRLHIWLTTPARRIAAAASSASRRDAARGLSR